MAATKLAFAAFVVVAAIVGSATAEEAASATESKVESNAEFHPFMLGAGAGLLAAGSGGMGSTMGGGGMSWCFLPMLFGLPPHPFCFFPPQAPAPPPPEPAPVVEEPVVEEEDDNNVANPGDQESVGGEGALAMNNLLAFPTLVQRDGKHKLKISPHVRAAVQSAFDNADVASASGLPNDAVLRGGPEALSPFSAPTMHGMAMTAEQKKRLSDAAARNNMLMPSLSSPMAMQQQGGMMQQQMMMPPQMMGMQPQMMGMQPQMMGMQPQMGGMGGMMM